MNLFDWLAGDNMGGLLELQCSPQVLLYGGVPSVMLGTVELTTEDPWLVLYCTEETRYWREQEQDTDHGPLWVVELGGFVPGDSAELRQVMLALQWWRWVVRGRDNNLLMRQAGNEYESLSVTAGFGVDPAMSGNRGYSIRFGQELVTRPVLV